MRPSDWMFSKAPSSAGESTVSPPLSTLPHPPRPPIPPRDVYMNWNFLFSCLPSSVFPFSQGKSRRVQSEPSICGRDRGLVPSLSFSAERAASSQGGAEDKSFGLPGCHGSSPGELSSLSRPVLYPFWRAASQQFFFLSLCRPLGSSCCHHAFGLHPPPRLLEPLTP